MKQSRGPKTIIFPSPVFIVGTYDEAGKPNLMAAAWGGICCSKPPCLSVSLRKATYTYGAIVARGAFTVNIASEQYVKEADYVGMVSGRDVDKFAATGLTPVRSELVDAPYVAEFPLVVECSLLHTLEIGLHTLFIGEIRDVKGEADVLDAEGKLDILKVKPLIFAPDGGGYYGVGPSLGSAFTIGNQLKKP
ncbi:MAG TPA: flavin reductase family protein [Anaerolineae bacterium]|nr:flavin reductase family protein [Anaerolineae bacterium]